MGDTGVTNLRHPHSVRVPLRIFGGILFVGGFTTKKNPNDPVAIKTASGQCM